MTKTVRFAFVTLAALGLAACGKSVDANQSATADTVEVPAEEAMASATALPTEAAIGVASDDVSTDAAADQADGSDTTE